ncbi:MULTISPECIES: non-homologous end joining protein Ku [unclassified Rhizobium]|uniref:non-homologous end joining protein Ku n=1 Tax=unclassified Rhizobium TaxID=2613769 RepID=UPI001AD97359|nr:MULTISPECIES: Ku protein [unclassified Rhizobium]MBO9097034.1 Ku protein [Rhizobium sp. L58/93]MBO9134114.1 Ku protein [Rhizobium sp. B209b/85]MBO9167272.1 Ku protein [Rhizobium sp. L245/93]MBO9183231.1 Ku protein [Rhizobium sp. E27B/91]QXZ83575.1 Ku protein [Rhizobium sp. K1/93]
MTARASWKGQLTIGALSCSVGLYTAVSSSERLSFHIINRKTGNRVERQFVDSETGKPVERDDQVKGYLLDDGEYLVMEGDELASIVPESDKVLSIESFIGWDDIDRLYFDRPYFLMPVSDDDREVLALVIEAMNREKVAALAHAVLFRRYRTLLVRPYEKGLVATMLNFDYEVRSEADAFEDIPELEVTGEMLELASHIIDTKKGTFDASAFDDRYEEALVELVKAKVEGKPLPKKPPVKEEKVVDLMQALRESAGMAKPKPGAKTKKAPAQTKKAG